MPVLRINVLGTRFAIRSVDTDVHNHLAKQWSRCLADDDVDVVDEVLDLSGAQPRRVGRSLLTRATIRAIELAAGTRLMLHAAGVADDLGRVVALVGRSGSGKTTAATQLSRRGYGYVTDETVSIGSRMDVLPFPRPLSIRNDRSAKQISPDDLGLARASDKLTLGRIVILDRRPQHVEPPAVAAVPLLDAILELIPQASALASLPEPLAFLCRVIEMAGGVVRLTYRDLDEDAVKLIAELLSSPLPTGAWSSVNEPVKSGSETALDAKGYRRASVRDAVAADDETLVLMDRIPVRLSGIGHTIWRVTRSLTGLDALVDEVESCHGTHPEARELVLAAIDEMLRAGVLIRVAGAPSDSPLQAP